MKINGPADPKTAQSMAAERRVDGPVAAKPDGRAAAVDTVRLSDLSSQLASGAIDLNVPFDRARVDAVKLAIRDGQFNVDSGIVADRMLASAMALLGRDR